MGTICSNTPDSGPICWSGSHFYTLGYFIVRIKTQTMLMRDRKVSKWQKYKQFFCRLLRSQQKPPKILDDGSAEIDKVCGAATKLFGLSWLFSPSWALSGLDSWHLMSYKKYPIVHYIDTFTQNKSCRKYKQ